MQIRNFWILGSSILALLPAAFAQGFYVDGGYAATSLELEFEDDDAAAESLDLDFGAIGGHAGYDFTPYFGVEGEVIIGVKDKSFITVGVSDDDESVIETENIDVSLNSIFGVYAKANLPLGEQFNAFARVGYAVGELEASSDLDGSENEKGTEEGVAFGVGATFDFTQQIYARGDYTRYDFGEADTDAFMAGVGFRF